MIKSDTPIFLIYGLGAVLGTLTWYGYGYTSVAQIAYPYSRLTPEASVTLLLLLAVVVFFVVFVCLFVVDSRLSGLARCLWLLIIPLVGVWVIFQVLMMTLVVAFIP